ncbi:MAG: ferrous iron transporter B [Clostridia bacterium]|jgi:ferrous iron transport protein B|nr:ferrous iron transporter B [Clostridia bacterium]
MKKFALAGNPNCGKTTLFNLLTGSTAYVGNWPGVTVDKREGTYKGGEEKVDIVDLPGIYSLSPYTPEEIVSRNYILDEKPDCVINIVDATNLERNLYLTTQLMEIDVPVIIALNMMDAVEKSGDKIDAKALEQKTGLPVVAISALKGAGIKELMDRAIKLSKEGRKGETLLKNSPIAHLIRDVAIALEGQKVENPLFHAVKLSEMDEIEAGMHPELVETVDKFKATFTDETFGTDFEAIVADARYKYISANYSSVVEKKNTEERVLSKSDKADRVLTHRIWGIPIFLVILLGIFHLTFSENLLFLNGFTDAQGWMPTLEELGMDTGNAGVTLLACFYDGAVFSPGVMITNLWNWIIGWIGTLLELCCANAAPWVGSFVVDGIWGGLSAVLGFLPQILVLFLFFSILEDSGYMARVAFILDRIFRKFGLSGRAFMPMIMGFGCSLPAMINTRTLADEQERTATVRVIPFFSCGAKLPILTAVAGAIVASFGVGNADLITYGMYVLGIVTAIVCVLIMRSTTMRGDVPPFIMELPTYHRPLFKGLMIHLWDKTKHFVKKAFTIIFASTIIIWFLSSFSWEWRFLLEEVEGNMVNLQTEQSILGSIGMLIQPLFTPLGFGSQLGANGWVFAVAALTGLVAKENVIATFGTLAAAVAGSYIATEEGITEVVAMIGATGITIPALISFIAFNMLTIPCFAACATAKAELPKGKFKWTLLFWVCTSYIVSSMIYLIGSWWWTAFVFAAAIAAVVVTIVLWNKKRPALKKAAAERKAEQIAELAVSDDEKEEK